MHVNKGSVDGVNLDRRTDEDYWAPDEIRSKTNIGAVVTALSIRVLESRSDGRPPARNLASGSALYRVGHQVAYLWSISQVTRTSPRSPSGITNHEISGTFSSNEPAQ